MKGCYFLDSSALLSSSAFCLALSFLAFFFLKLLSFLKFRVASSGASSTTRGTGDGMIYRFSDSMDYEGVNFLLKIRQYLTIKSQIYFPMVKKMMERLKTQLIPIDPTIIQP
jgi:hypothetical protein